MHKLDLKQVALSFGFTVPPKVELRINTKMGAIKRRGGGGGFGEGYKEAAGGGGAFSTGKNFKKKGAYDKRDSHKFSASNPYGQKASGDKRQFNR